ncbi:unnamed protein product [Blumeria hordei]|uniref:MARVEL domain-containing protein n=1 Tax=Blumeria hordei TaxID=2867405 RepID=A0A383UP27_BLUHO|nr:unnamed protein product [Blumeria hordei]
MHLADIISLFLRVCELIFSAIVIGLTASWLHANRGIRLSPHNRFIYTEVVAALAFLVALFLVLPFTRNYMHWPVDVFIFITTMIAFGLMVNYSRNSCNGIGNQGRLTSAGRGCDNFKTDISFIFLTSIFFLASAILGFHYTRRNRRNTVVDKQMNDGGKRWHRRG